MFVLGTLSQSCHPHSEDRRCLSTLGKPSLTPSWILLDTTHGSDDESLAVWLTDSGCCGSIKRYGQYALRRFQALALFTVRVITVVVHKSCGVPIGFPTTIDYPTNPASYSSSLSHRSTDVSTATSQPLEEEYVTVTQEYTGASSIPPSMLRCP